MPDEKPFEPTQARLERAKREGDAARSQEVGNVAAFAAALTGTAIVAAPIAEAARNAFAAAAAGTGAMLPLAALCALMLLPAACAACAAVAVTALQSGGFRMNAVALKFERLAPAENLKRMFSKKAAVTAARATAAVLCACAALLPAFAQIAGAALHSRGLPAMASAAWHGALRATALACVVGGVFAAADYGLQLGRWRKRLRMSHEELRRDHKEQDGDPLARSRRRALHRRISRGSLGRVKEAAFVLTNPTHIAIALQYGPPEVPVPRVLVRAADDAAIRVRELAAQFGVPVVENVALARLLYAGAQAGDYIPHECYLAVAEVVCALTKTGVLA